MHMGFVTRHYRTIYVLCCIGLSILASNAHATVEYVFQSGLHWYQTQNPMILSNRESSYNNTQYDNSSGLFKESDYNKYHSSDDYWTHDLGAGLYIPFPTDRSALQIVGKTSQDHENSFSSFKNRNHQWEAQYQWELSSWLRGKVRHSDDLREYSYFNGFPKQLFTYYNPATQQKFAPTGDYLVETNTVQNEFELGLKITPHWEIPFNIKRTAVKYLHDNDVSPYNFDSKAYTTGIRYESGKHSVFTLGVRTSDTNFPMKGSVAFYKYNPVNLLSNNSIQGTLENCINDNTSLCNVTEPAYYTSYKDNEIFTDNAWQYSSSTILRGSISYLNRKFNQGQVNHLYDIQLGIDWSYLPKTAFIFQIWNKQGVINDTDNRRTLQTRGAQLYTIWKPTFKSSFTGRIALEQEHYDYFDTGNLSAESDKTIHLGIQYDYDMTPTTRLSVFAHQRRSSSKDGTIYKNTAIWAGITYSFENMRDNNRARVRLDQLQ